MFLHRKLQVKNFIWLLQLSFIVVTVINKINYVFLKQLLLSYTFITTVILKTFQLQLSNFFQSKYILLYVKFLLINYFSNSLKTLYLRHVLEPLGSELVGRIPAVLGAGKSRDRDVDPRALGNLHPLDCDVIVRKAGISEKKRNSFYNTNMIFKTQLIYNKSQNCINFLIYRQG